MQQRYGELDADTRLRLESEMLVLHIDRFVTKNYGVRCDEHEDGCPICFMWQERDRIKEFLD